MDIVKVAAFSSKNITVVDFLRVIKDAVFTQGPESGKK
jgi:hypothetical protein